MVKAGIHVYSETVDCPSATAESNLEMWKIDHCLGLGHETKFCSVWLAICSYLDKAGIRVYHYNDVIMTTIASQITSLTVVYSTVYSDAAQRKHQNSASLAFVWGIHRDRWIPHTKGQLRRKCFHLMTSSCSETVNFVKYFDHTDVPCDYYHRTPNSTDIFSVVSMNFPLTAWLSFSTECDVFRLNSVDSPGITVAKAAYDMLYIAQCPRIQSKTGDLLNIKLRY